MRCGICGKRFVGPDDVLYHAYIEHDFDFVESLTPDDIILTELEWLKKRQRVNVIRKKWCTSKKLWKYNDGREAYLIGYFPNPKAALKVKREMEERHGIVVGIDIRMYGIVKKADVK